MDKLKQLYVEYATREFGFIDLDEVEQEENELGLMYTELEDGWEVQVSYDLKQNVQTLELTNGEKKYFYANPMTTGELKEELENVSFQDYYSWAHFITERVFKLDLEF